MIFYFSGTGNSKWAAKSLAGLLHDKTADILDSISNGEIIEKFSAGIQEEGFLGFVFPVYAWGVPEVVADFAKKLKSGRTLEILRINRKEKLLLSPWQPAGKKPVIL